MLPYTWIELSKSALLHNIHSFRSLLREDTAIIAAVKGNAYGHGLVEVSAILAHEADYFAVINLREARLLRESGIQTPIIILGYIDESKESVAWLYENNVALVVNSLTHAQRIAELALGKNVLVHVKIDTGMGRMGILSENASAYVQGIAKLSNLSIQGIMSHFADTVGHADYTKKQFNTFTSILSALKKEGINPPLKHIAKTEAILNFPESQLSAVRPGIGLYGVWPDRTLIDGLQKSHPEFLLKPVLSWKANILQVKTYETGAHIGYGCTYQTRRQTRVAVLPIGYYEGFDRSFSNNGEVLINGMRCPIIGRVCMNMCMADVTDCASVQRGDEVVIIGTQGNDQLHAYEHAQRIDTIAYEIVTRINPFILRKIVD